MVTDTEERVDQAIAHLMEHWLEGELECEMDHDEVNTAPPVIGTPCPPCSTKATARYVVSCLGAGFVVCAEFEQWIRLHHEHAIHCGKCQRPTRVCWRIVPL